MALMIYSLHLTRPVTKPLCYFKYTTCEIKGPQRSQVVLIRILKHKMCLLSKKMCLLSKKVNKV